jgi:Fic family protein
MFIVSEIHPFEDGNGKIVRVMMNAELVYRNQCKIKIPTVLSGRIFTNIKKLIREKDPVTYVQMLSKVNKFSSYLNNDD